MSELEPWARDRIDECAPGRGLGVGALQRLMHACAALKAGSGDLFGMSVGGGVELPSTLYPRACATLQLWIPLLDEHLQPDGRDQVLQYIRAKGLDVELSTPPVAASTPPQPPEVTPAQVEAAQHRLSQLQPLWTEAQWAALMEHWATLVDRGRSGLAAGRLDVREPLDAADLARIEAQMKRPIPDELLRAGLHARHVGISWSLPRGTRTPPELSDICGGPADGVWSFEHLPQLADEATAWCFDFLDPDEARLWQDSIALAGVGSNFLALLDGRVVFLHHENDPGLGHGKTLAPDLAEFVERWTALACFDPDWPSIAQFAGSDGLDPTGDIGTRWAALREELAADDDTPDWLAAAYEDDDD